MLSETLEAGIAISPLRNPSDPPLAAPGGLCPGLNDVIRQIVLTLDGGYGVTSITGAQRTSAPGAAAWDFRSRVLPVGPLAPMRGNASRTARCWASCRSQARRNGRYDSRASSERRQHRSL